MTLYYNKLLKRLNENMHPYGIISFPNRLYEAKQEAQPGYADTEIKESTRSTGPTRNSGNTKNAENTDTIGSAGVGAPGVRVTSEAIIDCANEPAAINPFAAGAVAKIPIILAELTVQVNVNSVIDLPEWTNKIKGSKKRVKIIQCLLLQNTNTLFIKGCVRKNIEYVKINSSGFSGDIRDVSVEIPFKCTTGVIFNGNDPVPLIPSRSVEFEYQQADMLSDDFTEFNQISTAFYNELPFCELTSSRIVEIDEHSFERGGFKSIEEKMVIYLTLKILQYCKVAIPPHDFFLK